MPKIKKHSQRLSRLPSDLPSEKRCPADETQAENSESNGALLKPTRMRHSEMAQYFSNAGEREAATQPKQAQMNRSSPEPLTRDEAADIFLNKYTDNDEEDIDVVESSMGPQRKQRAKPKKDIRTSNKMFTDLSYMQELGQQRLESHGDFELEVDRKHRRQPEQFMDKFQKKAEVFKSKLDYKDLNKDGRYRNIMQSQLMALEATDQIELVVQVPKLFAGKKSQVEAALFLRNTREEKEKPQEVPISTQTKVSQASEDETSMPKDRRSYYQQLSKQVRFKKAEVMTQSTLKECFKQSILDDKDFIPDFQNSKDQYRADGYDQSQLSRPPPVRTIRQSQTNSTNGRVDSADLSSQDKTAGLPRKGRPSKPQPRAEGKSPIFRQKQAVGVEASKEEYKFIELDTREEESESKGGSSEAVIPPGPEPVRRTKPPKPKRQRKQKKRSQFAFKDLIEVQADISDDEEQGGPRHNDEGETESDNQSDLDSLIDDDVKISRKDRQLLQRKYISDVMEQEERRYEEIRKKMEKKYFEDEDLLRKRMGEAARKNVDRDKEAGGSEQAEVDFDVLERSTSYPTSNCTAEKEKNREKLAQLQQLLGKQKRQEREVRADSAGTRVSKLEEIEMGLLSKANQASRKSSREGFKNIQIPKKAARVQVKHR